MADALCGPSNALQNFQKHSSVDRTLQQDRLVGKHSPSQSFRSSNGINSGAIDSEFEAFQAGHAGPPQVQPDFHHLPLHLARAPQPPSQFTQAPGAPDWASDFQRLNVTNEHVPALQQHRAPPAAASWHQDFMKQQAPVVHKPTYLQQNGLGGMLGYGMGRFGGSAFQQPMGFGGMNGGMVSEVTQGKQRAQESVPQLDEAAFEQAFAQMDRDMVDETTLQQEQTKNEVPTKQGITSDEQKQMQDRPLATEEAQMKSVRPEQERREEEINGSTRDFEATGEELNKDSLRGQRPAVNVALKLRSALDIENAFFAERHLTDLENMEQSNKLVADASEARWIVETLQNTLNSWAPQEVKTRVETLIRAINERLMSTYPLLSLRTMPLNHKHTWEEPQAAGYTRGPVLEDVQQQHQRQPEQEQKEEQPLQNDDDEMANTAGRLLERVADNTSEKFQNSQFLELMRKLRDREVKVEGDKMVEVSAQSSSTPSQQQLPLQQPPPSSTQQQLGASSAIPGIDPKILDHADTDFSMPVFSEEAHDEYAPLSRQSSKEHATDEISGQFSYYNVHAAYHK